MPYCVYYSLMTTKASRHNAIRQLVDNEAIATQAVLIKLLGKQQLAVDQATLSRDLAELNIEKRGGHYQYVEPEPTEHAAALNVAAAVKSIEPCGPNMTVIRTGVGEAQVVAVAIDQAKEPTIIATLGGDDVVVVLTKSSRTQSVALRKLEAWFGAK